MLVDSRNESQHVTTGSCVHYSDLSCWFALQAFELLTFFVCSLLLLIRLIVEFQSRSGECSLDAQSVCAVFLGIAVVFNFSSSVLCRSMYTDLKWKKYKAIGAEVQTRRMYLRFELFSAVKKLDLQFSLITMYTGLVFFTDTGDSKTLYAMIANLFVFVIEIIWERLGDSAVKTENEISMYIYWALSIFLPAFIVNIGIEVFAGNLLTGATDSVVRGTIAAFALLAIINRVGTVICTIILFRDFGTTKYAGLKRILANGSRIARFKTPARIKSVQVAKPAGAKPSSPSPKVSSNPLRAAQNATPTVVLMPDLRAGTRAGAATTYRQDQYDDDNDGGGVDQRELNAAHVLDYGESVVQVGDEDALDEYQDRLQPIYRFGSIDPEVEMTDFRGGR
jgi:hypothetical protein